MAELIRLLASWRFTSPVGLWLGGALLCLCALYHWRRRPQGLAFDLGYWSARVELGSRRARALGLLALAAAALMVLALGAPEVLAREPVRLHGRPVMAVIDISGSMDYRARIRPASPGEPVRRERSNIEKARAVFQEMLGRDLGVDYGLLLYSSDRYIARYFTPKKALLADTLENDEEIAFISTGTRTAEALTAARRFLTENVQAGDGAILLISDMQGDLEALVAIGEELENCQYAGLEVYVIVIGADDPQASARKPPALAPVPGVTLVHMNDRAGLDLISQELATMENAVMAREEVRVRRSVVPHLAAAALGLVGACLVLLESACRRIP